MISVLFLLPPFFKSLHQDVVLHPFSLFLVHTPSGRWKKRGGEGGCSCRGGDLSCGDNCFKLGNRGKGKEREGKVASHVRCKNMMMAKEDEIVADAAHSRSVIWFLPSILCISVRPTEEARPIWR